MTIPNHAKTVFEGVLFDVYQWQQELFDGTTTTFEAGIKTPVCAIFAITPEKKILYLKQEQPNRPLYYSIPAGRIEQNEKPIQAVQRELLEETGYNVDTIQPFHTVLEEGKIIQEETYFIGYNAQKITQQNLDGGEKIEILSASFEEFCQLIRDPNFLIHPDIKFLFYEALLDKQKMDKLRNTFLL